MSLWEKTDPKSVQKALGKVAKLGNSNRMLLADSVNHGKNSPRRQKLNKQLGRQCDELEAIAKNAASAEVACAAIDALYVNKYYTNSSSVEAIALESPHASVKHYALKQLSCIYLFNILDKTNDPQLFAATLDELMSERNRSWMKLDYGLRGPSSHTYGKELLRLMNENPAKFRPYWHKLNSYFNSFVTTHEDAHRHGDSQASSDCHQDSNYHVDTPAGKNIFNFPPYPFDD